jgi:hypothetical protein
MSKSVFLMVTSAFMVGGAIAKAGEIVEVSNAEAKDLLNRGKAKLATIDAAQLEDAVEVESKEGQPAGAEAPQEAATEVAQGEPAAAETKPAKPSKKGK